MDYSEYYVYNKPKRPVFNIGKVTKNLILICIAGFIISMFLPEDFLLNYLTFNSINVFKAPWTLVSNAFLHADLFHLLFNCFALFMFGSIIELRHGSKFMLFLFFSSVIIANIAFGYFNPGIYGLGISGYVYAIIGAAVVLEPRARVIFPIGFFYTTAPVSIAGPIMFITELIFSISGSSGIGHIAHAAGFVIGVMVAYYKKKKEPRVFENHY